MNTLHLNLEKEKKTRMENTKHVKIFVAASNMTTFVENTTQKGTQNRKRNKINLKVATTFGARKKKKKTSVRS